MRIGFALIALFICLKADAQTINRDEFRPSSDGPTGETKYERKIDIGHDVNLTVTVDVTVRGNGTLKVANLSLRVLDEYDDGLVYEEGLLHVEFVDVTGDGYKDLVITGIARHTGDRQGEPVTREVITEIFVFEPKTGEFRKIFSVGPKLDI